jgi:hypothetical protein
MGLREQILSANDARIEKVPVPEWGFDVWVRSMTSADRDAFEAAALSEKDRGKRVSMENFRARLAARTVCDADGTLLFSEHDVTELGKKSAAAMDRIFGVAARINGMSNKDVEELAKN